MSHNAPIIELPDIVQSLQNKQWSGTLEIAGTTAKRRTCFFFRDGMIQHCSPDRNPLVLGRALFQLEMIDEADYVMTMVDYEQTGRKTGEVLVELGLVDEASIRSALVFQGREHVLDVFNWKDVDVRFHPGEEKLEEVFTPQQREVNLNLAGMSILMEAARRSDEWEMVGEGLPTGREVPAALDSELLAAGHLDRRVALLIDGYRSAQEIADQAPMNTLEVLQALAGLVREGVLRLLEPPDLVKVGVVAEEDGDYEKALAVYDLAAEGGLDHLDLHRRVARVYTLLGRRDEALARWRQVADRCLEVDRSDLAIAALVDASELAPNDLELKERLVALHLQAGGAAEAAAVLRPLLDQAEAQGASRDKLAELQASYLELQPEDKEILERLAQLHLALDNGLQAMERLDELATVLTAEGALEESVAVYYRVLEIDGENLQARLLLAKNLGAMGSTDDAVREYRRLADVLYRSGVIGNSINWPFLIRVYESIVELEPSSTAAWEWLAKAYLENEQEELAISRYIGMADSFQTSADEAPPPEILQPLRRVVELAPARLDVRRRLVDTHLALGQAERAVRCLRELAEEALRAELIDEAGAAYREALEHQPFDMESRRGLAALHERLGEQEEAYAAWRAVGLMCHQAGLLEQAGRDLHRAFQFKSDDPLTVRELAEIEEARGKGRNAAMLYARYAQLMIVRANYGSAREALEAAARLEPSLPQVAALQGKLAAVQA